MGRPMAENLLRAGFPLKVYGRRPEAVEPLLKKGAGDAGSAAAAASGADVVFLMVSDTPDVEAVLFGPDGVSEGIATGAVVVDCSTISPQATRNFARRLGTQGVQMLDAPVSGGEAGAVDGTLSIMVGGKADVFERVLPLLQVMGKNIVHVGDHGAGQVAKACNQILVGITLEGVAEAIAFARAQGVDAAKVREALLGGFAYSRILEVHGKRMLEGNFRPGFKVRLHAKDMRIVMKAAHALGLDLGGASLFAERMQASLARGDGELDSSSLIRLLGAGE
jgi:2-hydroxy-3-oxopropionate reductase